MSLKFATILLNDEHYTVNYMSPFPFLFFIFFIFKHLDLTKRTQNLKNLCFLHHILLFQITGSVVGLQEVLTSFVKVFLERLIERYYDVQTQHLKKKSKDINFNSVKKIEDTSVSIKFTL